TAVAKYLDLPAVWAYEVASFYSMLETKPVGRNNVAICTNISCWLNGAEDLVKHCEKKLGIKLGESTADGRVYLKQEEECIAACVYAPAMTVNGHYHERLTTEKLDAILDGLSKNDGEQHRSGRTRTPGSSGRLHHAAFRQAVGDGQLRPDGWLQGVEEDPRREARSRRPDRGNQEVQLARPRRRGLPHRPEVVLHAEGHDAEVHPVQLGRVRARHGQGPRHPALQPARGDRGHGHCLLLHRLDRGLQLPPWRIPPRAVRAPRRGAEGSVCGRPARQERAGQRHRRGYLQRARRRRLHLRRGNRADGVA